MQDSIVGQKYMPEWVKKGVPTITPSVKPDDFMEIFSQRRIVPFIARQGQQATTSIDLVTGWDLTSNLDTKKVFTMINLKKPKVVMLSPPCTTFSTLIDCIGLRWTNSYSKMP